MAYTSQNNLENQVSGQSDWDTSLNSNMDILDRGYHGTFTAGASISSGAILWAASGAILHPYNPRSLSLRGPTAMAYKAVNSGESDRFLLRGIVTSIGVWSGKIVAGQPVYASPSTAGFAVASYSAAAFAAGVAISATAIYFSPGQWDHDEEITYVQSLGALAIGSTHAFTLSLGNRGYIRRVEIQTNSFNLWTSKFHSGSARVSSELLFESQSGGVTSVYLLDAAGFPYKNTDTASPGMLFGNILVSSGVGSAHIYVSVVGERFR